VKVIDLPQSRFAAFCNIVYEVNCIHSRCVVL
jgi:hypothetical protein